MRDGSTRRQSSVPGGVSSPVMNPDSTRPGPDDDATGTGVEFDPDAVDTMALEALTATAWPDDEAEGVEIPHDEFDPMVGTRIGPYRLRERIGGGGMGSVYLADRVDGFAQRVAVKLIRSGMDSEAIVRRFRTEIHVQAALGRYPNIVGLIDAGTAEDGRPYFVMEHVDGERIDAYCDGRKLVVAERVRLFAGVCDAVQFAHQHAVIHRDLKPGNILVTADGVPKLIDFGIAKLLDPGPGGAGLGAHLDGEALTRSGELVMTPEYASPEQVMGEPVTTASDVYALGVVLYQLLTGRRPYRLRTPGLAEVFQAICEQSPGRPSTEVVRRPPRKRRRPKRRPESETTSTSDLTSTSDSTSDDPAATVTVTPAAPVPAPSAAPDPKVLAAARGMHPSGLRRALAGDLDTIVLTAMRKEPERRYASAGQLADDLRRHLEGLPVRARGDSAWYRVNRFVRRHAAAVAAAVLLVLALVGGVVGTTWGLVEARRERDRAEDWSREAQQAVDRFLTRVSDERLLDQPGMHPLRKELLEDARQFYERFLAERAGDPAVRAELAGAQRRLARITAQIGSPAEAAEQYRQAIAMWDELIAARPDDPSYREELADALNGEAILLTRLKGRRSDALEVCRRARTLIEPLATPVDAPARLRHLLGLILLNTAQVEYELGQPVEAVGTYRRVLEIEGQLADKDPNLVAPRLVMARVHAAMGLIFSQQPRGIKPAMASYEKAIEILDAVTREHPRLADEAYTMALDLNDLALLQAMAGKLDSALASDQRGVAILERLDRQYPGVLNYQGGMAAGYNMISDLHRRRQEPAESLAFAEKARPLLERLVAEHPEDTISRIDLSKTYNNIGRIQQQTGWPAEALHSFQRAVDLLESLPNLQPHNRYNLACNLSLCIPLFGAKPGTQGVTDEAELSPSDRTRRRLYGDRAITVLRRAVKEGFHNTDALQSDPDLQAIRDREDFQAIIKGLR